MKQKLSSTTQRMAVILLTILLSYSCIFKNKSSKVVTIESAPASSVQFTYTDVTGIGVDSVYNRRDNSDVLKVGNKYYVYYSRMNKPRVAGYWATIWYATSEDEGHNWKEQGMALGLGAKGSFDSHSVFTPNILEYNKKYYLYYTAVKPTPGTTDNSFENNSTNDFTAIGLAVADSPDGPFVRVENNPVLTISKDSADFDSYRVDDASLLVRDNKIWLYYKGRSIIHGEKGWRFTQMGVAFADKPEGPFIKHPSPILEKSHEVLIWNQDGGVASLASFDKSINLAPDGINFAPIHNKLVNIPSAPGLYRPSLSDEGRDTPIPGWGISLTTKKGPHFHRFEMIEE